MDGRYLAAHHRLLGISPGCTNCYAMKLAGTRLQHHPSRAGLTDITKAGPVWNGQVRFNERWLDQPLRWKRPRRIFVCAHGDLFHEAVPDAWIDRVFAVMALAPQHTFQVLTKRAERMRDYVGAHDIGLRWVEATRPLTPAPPEVSMGRFLNISPEQAVDWTRKGLPNVWLGVSVEDQARADERIPLLLDTPAAKRFISAEPLLGPINLARLCILPKKPGSARAGIHVDALRGQYVESGVVYKGAWDIDGPAPPDSELRRIDQVIAGGESGPQARPMHPAWPRALLDQCQSAGVAFFFKQWGQWHPDALLYKDTEGRCPPPNMKIGKRAAGRLLDGREWSEFPA